MIADFPLTPSDQIDQVWHLHLLYTQSYWIDFCKNTIQKDIHHGPTKGAEQKPLFKDQYLKTLEFYESVFKKKPAIKEQNRQTKFIFKKKVKPMPI